MTFVVRYLSVLLWFLWYSVSTELKKYIATIYTDDVEVPGKIKITTRKITLKTKLSFMLQRSGGFSLKIMEL